MYEIFNNNNKKEKKQKYNTKKLKRKQIKSLNRKTNFDRENNT
jgi:hypothetical protein